MHYIRLMRPPSLDDQRNLKLVITITTDLGDSFLCPDEPVPISVWLTGGSSTSTDDGQTQTCCLSLRRAGKSGVYWKQGMRIIKLELPVPDKVFKSMQKPSPASSLTPTICIVASHNLEDSPRAADIPFDADGRIMAVQSDFPWPPEKDGERTFESMRRLALAGGGFLSVDERIGESIDRHVWDAGVVTTGVLVNMCQGAGAQASKHTWNKTPLLKDLLCSVTPGRPLNAIELGCGVGVLGIGLAAALYRRMSGSGAGDSSTQSPSRILLTDLADAEEVALANIAGEKKARNAVPTAPTWEPSVDTDFECLDWEEGKVGAFGPRARASSWDLVIISDCTYNVDMLAALVATISELHKLSMERASKSTRVMLATKPRHSSEKALFGLMDEHGWKVLESASQPLPVLGLEDQSVEIYLFGKDVEQTSSGAGASSTSASSAPKRRKLR
ncbi:hypothetical protein KVR01_000450 [Diaporthe batatas]|uniref:uncharacterized protein n=1 Tax=Diaporthe batatas TaxID=748121 RepID=UPI001D0421F2|nr:uncharacterized protein KVR01_000450 [Diaporthe batatas]KAG8169705.1 hypothetical protein KVR01_000450 [Diaporthe batatas]